MGVKFLVFFDQPSYMNNTHVHNLMSICAYTTDAKKQNKFGFPLFTDNRMPMTEK
jgi:hypothetical protein